MAAKANPVNGVTEFDLNGARMGNTAKAGSASVAPAAPSAAGMVPPMTSMPNTNAGAQAAASILATQISANNAKKTQVPPQELESKVKEILNFKSKNTSGYNSTAEPPKKKKGSTGKLLAAGMIVAAMFIGGFAVVKYTNVGGILTENRSQAGDQPGEYTNDDQKSCNGCVTYNGVDYAKKWISSLSRCKITNNVCSGSSGGTVGYSCPAGKPCGCYEGDNLSSTYAWCGGCVQDCISYSALTDGGCNAYVAAQCGTSTDYGAACATDAQPSGWTKSCTCGGQTVWFDRNGFCTCNKIGDGTCTNDSGMTSPDMGLCGVYLNTSTPGSACQGGSDGTGTGSNADKYTCDANSCSITSGNYPACYTMKFICSSTVGGNSCTETSSAFKSKSGPSQSSSFSNECGTVQQIDVECSSHVTSRTRINPPCDNPPDNPTSTPVSGFVCTGLTRNITSPAYGDEVVFTCSSTGTVDHYNFRYKVGSGTYQELLPSEAKSAVSAPLTVSSVGEYTVECQVCKSTDNTNCTEWSVSSL